MAWQSLEMYLLKRDALRDKKVKTLIKVYAYSIYEFTEAMTNLIAIPAGSIGTVTEYDESPNLPADFITVSFPDGLYANISLATVEFIH